MSIFDKIQKTFSGGNFKERDAEKYAFVDVESEPNSLKINDVGALRYDEAVFHKKAKNGLDEFLKEVDFLCGHNIVHHDARLLWGEKKSEFALVDTLYLSPLLFPERPYHRLLKDEKLQSDELNNPVNDCKKSRELLRDEIAAWRNLPEAKRLIFIALLQKIEEFSGFIEMAQNGERLKKLSFENLCQTIRNFYKNRICANCDLGELARAFPAELAFALALIDTSDHRSITPPWVLKNFPNVEFVLQKLRHTKCADGCDYCREKLDVRANLKAFFGFENFRTYDGEPLQERAAQAATDGESLLAIFPTGGGKSLTFQLPAFIQGRAVHGLTVVISPLQSLMKDQVDNLAARGITEAVTINGLLNPIERAEAIDRVADGTASLLYISPESLRSRTIQRILQGRTVVRFVIDEAHCFSSWGQDFRVDYLYIGKFIRTYQELKNVKTPIPVSCFTATAKQKVVQDICDYFKRELGLTLEIFASKAVRTNLRYSVIHAETDDEKYQKLRSLVIENSCPTIVYVSRTKRTLELAQRLTRDGFEALPFNGKMPSEKKVENQEKFMSDKVRIIVATSAFGMGVDKKDVGLVVHYDISDSLENYVQEAGRAGRDPSLNARCYVLFCDSDLDKHFILLNQTKLSISEIQQVWRAIKTLTRQRETVSSSALEIARAAGWDDSVSDVETRIRTAISALEQSGFLERGNNIPHVFATGILVKNVDEARKRISESKFFEAGEIETAVRVIKSLISKKNGKTQDEAESRVDYLADTLGLQKSEVVFAIERMKQEGILADSRDMTAFLREGESAKKMLSILAKFAKLEKFLLEKIPENALRTSYKMLNDEALNAGISTSREKDIRTLLYFLTVKDYISKNFSGAENLEIVHKSEKKLTLLRHEKRVEIAQFIVNRLFSLASENGGNKENSAVQFSVIELLDELLSGAGSLFSTNKNLQLSDLEEALLYLSIIGVVKIEGGFLVLYNAMKISRLKEQNARYTKNDYRMLDEFYRQKIQQVHIVGEYANLMVKNYDAALKFVHDYFHQDYKIFIAKYFKGERLRQIQQNITPQKFQQIFGALSEKQREIIADKTSRTIVVAAGPGSGKTRVLVHKLASLILLEDVKHEQLLMLTFSRSAASEFKARLLDLIGNAAHFVEIKTFHSYAFDLLGRIGNIDEAGNVVSQAATMISEGEVEPVRIGKTVLVIDEAQDMSADEFALVQALMQVNDDLRVIAVGDDDQNIYEFRGSDSRFFQNLTQNPDAKLVEMTENFRSAKKIVDFANSFVQKIPNRIKQTPIVAMSKNVGKVSVVRHKSQFLYEPLAENLVKNRADGTVAVLTQTNEEAAILVALLRKKGVDCKLIQSMDGIRFYNLAMVRYFLKQIENQDFTTNITDEIWQNAKQKTFENYAQSDTLPILKRCIEIFEKTNKEKFLTDFKEFVFESAIEDFCDLDGAQVVVSTIHKAKGKEFDDVFLLVDKKIKIDAAKLRNFYVAITRAKKRLFVHTSGAEFDLPNAEISADNANYSLPDEVVLQLSYEDVYLSFFKERKRKILALRAGEKLKISGNEFFTENNFSVAKLSKKMEAELDRWRTKGYLPTQAKIRFVAAWKPKDAPKDESESAVLLIDLSLGKGK